MDQRAYYDRVAASPDFHRLRRTHRSFVFPMTIAFVLWYLLYVLLSNYAPGFMGTTVVGSINIAFVLGIAQFVSTFAIAWVYRSFAARRLDGDADRIRAEVEAHLAARPEEDAR
ncbi:DUF485 domain-containing protein [Allostreptomyces psammosilenae]|uniref:DUF485 domain-containing protein n=1 Tax=Allostreptomyces psammosilenae TaxID=1892865 RepID=UPI0035E45159